MDINSALEWACSIAIVATALLSVTRDNPLYAALWLINSFLFTAVLWVVQEAVFIAFLQVLTYVGAIVVLVLFTIMLMDLRGDQTGPPRRRLPVRILAFGCAAGSGLLLLRWFHENPIARGALPEGNLTAQGHDIGGTWGGIHHVGWHLFSEGGLFPFEFITILLLATLIGCIDLTKRRTP